MSTPCHQAKPRYSWAKFGNKWIPLFLIDLFLAASPLWPSAVEALDLESVNQSVVRIFTVSGENIGSGSGFVIDASGLVVTNHHVIHDANKLVVADGGLEDDQLRAAEVRWQSARKDLALLRVVGLSRPPLPLAREAPDIGAPLHAIGFPGDADSLGGIEGVVMPSPTQGILSRALNSHWEHGGPAFFILQHTAVINPGNSGGPLINACGQVVGVNTAGVRESGGSGMASGLYFATGSRTLIKELKVRGLPFTLAEEACILPAPGGMEESGLVPAPTPEASWLPLTSLILAGLALMFSVQRREQIGRAVNRQSRLLTGRPILPRRAAGPKASESDAPCLQPTDDHLPALDCARLRRAENGLTLGREADLCDIALNHSGVSSRHARLRLQGGQLWVEDLNSTNGTRINNRRLIPYQAEVLHPGDTLRLGGRVEYRYAPGEGGR